MVDGDEWKEELERKKWNSPENIWKDEYTSILSAHYEHVLRPVVQKGQGVDRDAVAMTKSDLEWKVKKPEFKKLPYKLQNAYQAFKRFVETLETTPDSEIALHREVLEGLFLLEISCHSHGDSMGTIYAGRNPCRHKQYKTNSALRKAERDIGRSQLLEAAKEMFDVCKKCPYK